MFKHIPAMLMLGASLVSGTDTRLISPTMYLHDYIIPSRVSRSIDPHRPAGYRAHRRWKKRRAAGRA